MTNNDIFRRIRYLFNYSDLKIVKLFKFVDQEVERVTVTNWLKRDDEPMFAEISDKDLAAFLNAVIIEKRGKREGPLAEAEDPLSNNMILRKLKIALDLRTDDILDLFALVDKKISKHELSAFFRNPNHKSYRPILDQYLRYFLNALQEKYTGNKSED